MEKANVFAKINHSFSEFYNKKNPGREFSLPGTDDV